MTSTTSGERVLIVEDEPTTRLGLTELVSTWGFTTESAADGQEALQRITTFRPSIIISDLVMPRMGGLELLRALKDEGSGLTIVILTAQGTVETAVEAIKEGAYDYLTKPVEPQRLKILLDKIVERAGHAARGEGPAQAAARARHVRQDDRQQRADAQGLPDHRAGGADVRHRCSSGVSQARARSSSRRRFIN